MLIQCLMLHLLVQVTTSSLNRRVWITSNKVRFLTSIPHSIVINRIQLKTHLEYKMQRHLRSNFQCGKIKSIVRSKLNSKTNDIFVKLTWRPMTCETIVTNSLTNIITVDVNRSSDSRIRNDSKERKVELSGSIHERARQEIEQEEKATTIEYANVLESYISMEEVERELASLELDVVELTINPQRKVKDPLQLLISQFFIVFVTIAAGTTVICWLFAYQAESLCAERNETKKDKENAQENQHDMKRSKSNKNKNIETNEIEKDPPNKTNGRNGNKKKKKKKKNSRQYLETAPPLGGLRVMTSKKRLEAHNYRIQQSVERLSELLSEAGPWDTTLDAQGRRLISCQGNVLDFERTKEMASYCDGDSDIEE